MSQTEQLLTVLDVGSAKTRVLVAELHDGALRYRGHGIVDSTGMRKGLIADLKPATNCHQQGGDHSRDDGAGNHRPLRCRPWRPACSRREQPGRHQPGHAPARDHARRCPCRRRSRSLRIATRGSRNDPPAAAAIHSRRAAGHSRSGRHGRQSSRSEPAHLDLLSASALQSVVTCANRPVLK